MTLIRAISEIIDGKNFYNQLVAMESKYSNRLMNETRTNENYIKYQLKENKLIFEYSVSNLKSFLNDTEENVKEWCQSAFYGYFGYLLRNVNTDLNFPVFTDLVFRFC